MLFFKNLTKGILMIKKITLAFALVAAFSGNVFASVAYDGSSDLIEAYGGTRNGGDC